MPVPLSLLLSFYDEWMKRGNKNPAVTFETMTKCFVEILDIYRQKTGQLPDVSSRAQLLLNLVHKHVSKETLSRLAKLNSKPT